MKHIKAGLKEDFPVRMMLPVLTYECYVCAIRSKVATKFAVMIRRLEPGLHLIFSTGTSQLNLKCVQDMNQGTCVGQVSDLVSEGTNLPPQDLQDPFMSNLADDPWLSAIFVPWDSMNF